MSMFEVRLIVVVVVVVEEEEEGGCSVLEDRHDHAR